jgi:hypothetical protein
VDNVGLPLSLLLVVVSFQYVVVVVGGAPVPEGVVCGGRSTVEGIHCV